MLFLLKTTREVEKQLKFSTSILLTIIVKLFFKPDDYTSEMFESINV